MVRMMKHSYKNRTRNKFFSSFGLYSNSTPSTFYYSPLLAASGLVTYYDPLWSPIMTRAQCLA